MDSPPSSTSSVSVFSAEGVLGKGILTAESRRTATASAECRTQSEKRQMAIEPISSQREDVMKKVSLVVLIAAVISALVAGAVAGFFAGVASTRAGEDLLQGLVEHEEDAEILNPQTIIRERFTLSYPSNWKVDVNDVDYDPDHNFSIESPGSTFVAFLFGAVETSPEDNIQGQIHTFSRIMDNPVITRFTKYGSLTGKGAILKGDILGMPHTARFFSSWQDGLTVVIVQQCPDKDMKRAGKGLSLIEGSFSLENG